MIFIQIFKIVLGLILFVVGIVGLLVPVMPGWLLIFPGLTMIFPKKGREIAMNLKTLIQKISRDFV
jgi:uncharacterized protein YqgC (DUF456 family)